MELKNRKKKGVFFSTDALIALMIIMFAVLLVVPFNFQSKRETSIHYDIMDTLSELKVSDINNSYVQTLIDNKVINDTDKTLLEGVGELYIIDKNLATNVLDEIFSNLSTNKNIGIWYDDTLVYSRNTTSIESAERIDVATQIISGISNASGSVTGFAARAFLGSDLKSKYFYFGGYVGDGNISVNVSYAGNLSSVVMELVVNRDFSVYVNGDFVDNYTGADTQTKPKNYSIPISFFHSGSNLLEFRGRSLHISGGFIKITYQSNVFEGNNSKYTFPGISGLINLYDGIYIPSNLTSMEVSLHANNNFSSMFLIIGNTTVFNGTTDGDETILLPNSYLSSLFNGDYSSFNGKTTPLRLGLENVTYEGLTQEIDVFSVTDLSGSMNENIPGSTFKLIDLVKDANMLFVEAILNQSGNRVGIVGYSDGVLPQNYHPLSSSSASLDQTIINFDTGGNTCICCGIIRAMEDLAANSSDDRFKSMVVMTDGKANKACYSNNPKEDAITAACIAYNSYNVTTYAIGYGPLVEEEMLMRMALDCGHGAYYYSSNAADLLEMYVNISKAIIDASYHEQTIEATGNAFTRLYPDSYIGFEYDEIEQPYGLIVNVEKLFDNTTTGTFFVPPDSSLVSAHVVSYSGPKWTDYVSINGNEVYDLSDYERRYVDLGDPYMVTLPDQFISENNSVDVMTALSSDNNSVGSQYNKIIYRIVKNISGFSPIVYIAEGCTWELKFEDNTILNVAIPSSYSGTNFCNYSSGTYNENDALQVSMYDLLKNLDLDLDGKIDAKFTEQDLAVDFSSISGVPFLWSTKVQVRTWY
jgi:Mg-chelatase subunit ChlD